MKVYEINRRKFLRKSGRLTKWNSVVSLNFLPFHLRDLWKKKLGGPQSKPRLDGKQKTSGEILICRNRGCPNGRNKVKRKCTGNGHKVARNRKEWRGMCWKPKFIMGCSV